MAKKKFKDTIVGKLIFDLGSKVPVIGPIISGAESVAQVLSNLQDSDLPDEDKLAYRLRVLEIEAKELDRDIVAQQEVSKRWVSDNDAGVLTRVIRPVILIFLTLLLVLFTVLDSVEKYDFKVAAHWVSLWTTLAVTVYGGYFVGKSIEKTFRK